LGDGGEVEKIMSVDFINVQGLTDVKAIELERIMSESRYGELKLVALLETHQKYRKINFSDELGIIERMRELKDKKGGGLMILYRKDDLLKMEISQRETTNSDILAVKVVVGCLKVLIALVYIDVKDKERNLKIYEDLNIIMQDTPMDYGKIIMGDFNAHVGFLGEQRLNINGELLLHFMEKWNLVMLNADDRCEGQYTRIDRNEYSVIDYMLVDEKMCCRFRSLVIDEKKEKFDLSDHCFILGKFVIECRTGRWGEKWETREYYKVNDENLMGEFVMEIENRIENQRIDNMLQFDDVLKKTADDVLKRTIRKRKRCQNEREIEPVWMNEDIRKEIKNRRKLNRDRRAAVDPETREFCWNKYLDQKEKVKKMVKDAKMQHEREITREIERDKTSKRMWDMINKLRGNREKQHKRIMLYSGEGMPITEESEEKSVMIEAWKQIYQMGENSIEEVWNEVRKEEYEEKRREDMIKEEDERVRRARSAETGMLYVGRVQGIQSSMEEVVFTKENLVKRLRKLKNGKKAGPDGLRGEIYKAMQNSDTCINTMLNAFNSCIENKTLGAGWNKSITKMIPKDKKPKAEQHRPIALTNVGYKLYMGMIGDRLAEQRMCDVRVENLQAGFTVGRRLEENLFMLGYCVEESYRSKNMLVVISVDFRKAFDSIDRRKMVEAMIYYKCDPKVIDSIVSLYSGDCTMIEREGMDIGGMEIKNGIRQGCTGSPTLFVMVVSRIIEKILQTGMGFRRVGVYIPVLFYADDGLLLAGSVAEGESMLRVIEEESRNCGLNINAEKSSFMVFNGRVDEGTVIRNLRECQEMSYLGMTIRNQRDIYARHREEKLKLAERMANISYSVMSRSCNRLLIGKTYWKSVVLPSVLKSSQVIVWNKTEKGRMQRIENGVWRKIFDAPSYTPVVTLQGEVGCSSVISRDMKCKLSFAKFVIEGKNGMMRKILNKMKQFEWKGRRMWIECVDNYLAELEMSWLDLESCTVQQIYKKIDNWEHRRWKTEVDSRSTLEYYRSKDKIGGESYTSGWGSRMLFRVRTNTVNLNWRARFWGGEVLCDICREEEESLEHFVLRCPGLEEVRRQFGFGNMEEVLCFGESNTDNVERFLERLWAVRWGVVSSLR